MVGKKVFGTFIKEKRIEKGYSQKDLADILYVTEGAISKWERGISYPDITLITKICNALNISEHELVTASNDNEAREIKQQAKKYRTVSSAWFYIPTISYLIALVTCFICNIAIEGTLSWFYIVLTALICAYSFIPTFTSFFNKNKLLFFTVTSYFSICLLLFTCASYTHTLYWFVTACIGVLIGYIFVLFPIIFRKTCISKYRFLISFIINLGLTLLLLLSVNSFTHMMLGPAILITCYAFIPAIIITFICTLNFNGFLKTSIGIYISSVIYYFAGWVINLLFGLNKNQYEIDFNNWSKCINGNIHFILITSLIFVGTIFLIIGIIRTKRYKKS